MPTDRKTAPSENGKINFELPEIKIINLTNGLKVYFIEKTGLPLVQMSLILNAGSKFDPEGASGVSNMTAQLLDEGAGSYSALELDEEFEFLGTDISISANHDNIYISMLSLEENFIRSLELFSTIIKEPQFNDNDFERERHKILSRIIQLQSDPSYVASVNFNKILHGNGLYSTPVLGNPADIEKLEKQEIIKFYENYFFANNAAIVIAGSLNHSVTTDLLNEYLGNWSSGKLPGNFHPGKIVSKQGVFIVHKDNAPQSEIRIGHLSAGRNTPDFYAKTLMNSVLGGQFSSRINLNLREDKGFTYGAHSSFSYRQEQSHFKVSTAVQTENTAAAVSEILKELKNIREEISEKELNFAKSNLVKTYPLKFETYAQLTGNLAALFVYSLPEDYFSTYIGNIEKTTLEETLTAARKNIDQENPVVLIVGDKNKISEDVEKVCGIKPEIIE